MLGAGQFGVSCQKMGQKIYTDSDRRKQLKTLEKALEKFIALLEKTNEMRDYAPEYGASLASVRELIAEGFDQAKLSSLSRSIPKLFWTHKEWVPPLVQDPSGNWQEPPWFKKIEPLHNDVHDAAELLRTIGEY